MKLLIATGALLIGLTPALAQSEPQRPEPPAPAQEAAPPPQQYPQDAPPTRQQDSASQPAAQDAAQQGSTQDSTQDSGQGSTQDATPPTYSRRPPQRPTYRRRELAVSPAVQPRAYADAYPVYREQQQFSVGAKLLSAKEVEQKFSTPLGKHYLVVEVGVFPASAQAIKLRPRDFTLRAAGSNDQAFFAAAPEDIASDLSPRPGRGGPRIYPSVGVGYENGPYGSGVSTGVGVGAGPRGYPRGAMGGNRRVMENELRDKSLPEVTLTQPAAGYLYFPLTGKRAKHYDLELSRNGETISLALPTPKN